MDEDLEILQNALFNLQAPDVERSNYESLYKYWGKFGNQEERRMRLLEIQRGNRNNKIDKFRGILDLVESGDDSKLFKPYKKAPYKPNVNVPGFNKTGLTYSNVLMLSEWMIEKPRDFSKNWYVVPCPKGMRLLVVANHGTTKFYSKYGYFKFELHTGLPGGNPHNCYRKNSCVLDCFFHEETNTMYLLDLLAWNNQPMTDGETEFRHYWMKTQLEDFPDTQTINKKNKVIIKILPKLPCSNHFLSYLLSAYPQFENNSPKLDGLLFYHKKAHYVAGETPLVGWLYPFMIPEVLGEDIIIHPEYVEETPEDYVNQADFIQKFEDEKSKKNKLRSSKNMNKDKDSKKIEKITTTNETVATTMEDEEISEKEKCDKEKEVNECEMK